MWILRYLLRTLPNTFFQIYNRESAAWQNGELEKQIVLVQDELRKSDYVWDRDDDLMKESARHKVYLDTIETLKEQLPGLKEKIKNAKICGAGEQSSEFEISAHCTTDANPLMTSI